MRLNNENQRKPESGLGLSLANAATVVMKARDQRKCRQTSNHVSPLATDVVIADKIIFGSMGAKREMCRHYIQESFLVGVE